MELVIDKYKLVSDQYNFTLYEYGEKVNPRDKSVTNGYSLIGFYPKIEHALRKLREQDIKMKDKISIDDILDCIKQSDKKIEKAVKTYKLQQERIKEAKSDEKEV